MPIDSWSWCAALKIPLTVFNFKQKLCNTFFTPRVQQKLRSHPARYIARKKRCKVLFFTKTKSEHSAKTWLKVLSYFSYAFTEDKKSCSREGSGRTEGGKCVRGNGNQKINHKSFIPLIKKVCLYTLKKRKFKRFISVLRQIEFWGLFKVLHITFNTLLLYLLKCGCMGVWDSLCCQSARGSSPPPERELSMLPAR